MIRSPIAARLDPDPSRSPRDAIREAAGLGAKGVVLEASGDLSPDRLSETGRRDLRHTLRSAEVALVALALPTRRGFDDDAGLDDRLARIDRALAMAYELGSRLALIHVGPVPAEEAPGRSILVRSLAELGRRGDHRGVRLAVETGTEPAPVLAAALDAAASPGLAASLDPSALERKGHDPISAARELGSRLAHAYAPRVGSAVASFRGSGVIDWAEYLGSLEEVDYRGFLTIWPAPSDDRVASFSAAKARLDRF